MGVERTTNIGFVAYVLGIGGDRGHPDQRPAVQVEVAGLGQPTRSGVTWRSTPRATLNAEGSRKASTVSAALVHPIGPTTVADWLLLEHPSDGSRLELIYGYLHVSPPPSGQHQHTGDELRALLKNALHEAGRHDLYAVTGVGVQISTGFRTALIPDVAILNTKPVGVSFHPTNLVLAVEIWSPGNSRTDRETKTAGYEGAGVPYFWVVNQDRIGASTVTAYYLEEGRYVEEVSAGPGTKVTIQTAAPVPVTFDPADLSP